MKHPIATDTATLEAGRARLAQDIAAIASESADLLKDAGAANLRRAQDALSAARVAIRNRGSNAADVTTGYVNAHPWYAIGIAACAGAVAGLLLARR
jgi:ElaB/YqjD/DUF883 family membrane-anchored ribosome-binding protein